MGTTNQISLTIDVESDWGGRLPPCRGNCVGIEKGIPQLLSLLEANEIKATFFISASIFPQYKELVKEIKAKRHEVASHGYLHSDYSTFSKDNLAYQISKSKEILEDGLNCEVFGFRMPQFRLHPDLYESLYIAGYKYDSSVVCGKLRGRYNNSQLNKSPFRTNYNILEIPISNIPMTNKPMGLLWINHLGFSVFSILDRLAKRESNIVIYLHPFDILDHKSKEDFNLLINFWYSFRSHSVLNTLRRCVDYYSENFNFVTLNKYLE